MIAAKAEITDIEERVRANIDKAVEFAKNSPVPKPQDLYTDVYA